MVSSPLSMILLPMNRQGQVLSLLLVIWLYAQFAVAQGEHWQEFKSTDGDITLQLPKELKAFTRKSDQAKFVRGKDSDCSFAIGIIPRLVPDSPNWDSNEELKSSLEDYLKTFSPGTESNDLTELTYEAGPKAAKRTWFSASKENASRSVRFQLFTTDKFIVVLEADCPRDKAKLGDLYFNSLQLPEDATSLVQRANSAAASGRLKEALANYEKAEKQAAKIYEATDPRLLQIKERMAETYRKSGDWHRARALDKQLKGSQEYRSGYQIGRNLVVVISAFVVCAALLIGLIVCAIVGWKLSKQNAKS